MNKNYLQSLSESVTNEYIKKNYYIEKELEVLEIKNGIILPPISPRKEHNPFHTLCGSGGVADADGNYVELSAQKAFGMNDRVYGAYDISKYEVNYEEEPVLYMNYFIKQWGHFMIDVIGRLWYVLAMNPKCKIAYTCNMNQDIEITGNYLEFLELMGIKKEQLLLVNKITRFSKIIIPESSIDVGKYYTKEYKNIFDTVIENALTISPCIDIGKVYCSRANIQSQYNKEKGEKEIEALFNDNGYKSVFMEKLSVAEQIRLINSASEIVMVNGSLAHNLLLLRNKRTKVTILNKTYRINPHQFLIDHLSGASVCYVDVFVSPLPVLYGYGPFIIKKNKELYDYCVDKNLKAENKSFESRLSFGEKILYYIKWINTYKSFLLRGKKIEDGGKPEIEKTYKEIREYYRNRIM